jgi:hypothetical protein
MTAQPCSGYSNKVAAKTEFKNNVVFDSNVGIGTCAPQARFHVMTRPSEGVIIGNRLTNAIYIDSSNGGLVGIGDIQNLQNKTSIFVADSFGYTGVQAERMKFLAGLQDGGYVFMGNETDNRNMVLIQDSIGHIKINSQNLIENITDSFRLTANWTNLINHVGGIVNSAVGGYTAIGTTFSDIFYTNIRQNRFTQGDAFSFEYNITQDAIDDFDSLKLVFTSLNDGTAIDLVKAGFYSKGTSTISVNGSCVFRSSDIKCSVRVFAGDSAVHVYSNQIALDPAPSYKLALQGSTTSASLVGFSSLVWFWPKKEDAW